jgi:hypothetical protein
MLFHRGGLEVLPRAAGIPTRRGHDSLSSENQKILGLELGADDYIRFTYEVTSAMNQGSQSYSLPAIGVSALSIPKSV